MQPTGAGYNPRFGAQPSLDPVTFDHGLSPSGHSDIALSTAQTPDSLLPSSLESQAVLAQSTWLPSTGSPSTQPVDGMLAAAVFQAVCNGKQSLGD